MNNNIKRYTKYATALAAATTAIGSASAAVITFGAADTSTLATDVSTNGTLAAHTTVAGGSLAHSGAINLVSDNSLVVGTTTVNGVGFTDSNLFLNGYSFSSGVNSGDAGLDTLASSVGYGGPAFIDMTGLTFGQQYEIQIFMADPRFTGRTITVGDNDGDASNDVTWTYNDSGATIQATSIIGIFTADATNQNFIAVLGGGGVGT